MPRQRRQRRNAIVKGWAKFIVVLAVIAFGMWAASRIVGHEPARQLVAAYGYPGAFLIAVVSGFNLVVPIPAVAFIPAFVAAGLEFWRLILIMALGMTLADTLAFLLGRTGRSVLDAKQSAALRRLERFREKGKGAPLAAMFVYACLAPFPNEVLAIPLGLMGYRVREIVPPLLAGNIVFNTLAGTGILGAYAGL